MTDNIPAIPTVVVRADHRLTAADMADAILSEFFHPGETGEDHGPFAVRAWTEELTRKHVAQVVRDFLQDRSTEHWRTLVAGHWTEEEIADAHTDAMIHVERCYPELIKWYTTVGHPASKLKLKVYPFDATPRWAQVERDRDKETLILTRTSNVAGAVKLYEGLREQFIREETEDLD